MTGIIKKVLLATINYDHPQIGMERAFVEVFGRGNAASFDYLEMGRRGLDNGRINAEFRNAVLAYKPDWVWLQLQDTGVIQAGTITDIRRSLPSVVITHWTGDCRDQVSGYLASISKSAHVTFISSVGQLPLFRAAGAASAHYLQIGVDWDEDVMGIPSWTPPFRIPDVVFCANGYGGRYPGTRERESAVRTLIDARIDIGVIGAGWSGFPVVGRCEVKQQHHIYKRAKVALNINNFNDIELYYSDRQLIAMASGTPLVCKYIPGLEREFKDDVHCLWFKTPGELVDRVRMLLSDPAKRERIGRAGREEIMKNHSWTSRIRSILPLITRLSRNHGILMA